MNSSKQYVELAAASNFSFLRKLLQEKCETVFRPQMRLKHPRRKSPAHEVLAHA